MDLRKLKTLIDLVETSGIAELEIQEGEERVRITRTVPQGQQSVTFHTAPQHGACRAGAGDCRAGRSRRARRARRPRGQEPDGRHVLSLAHRRAPSRSSRSATRLRKATRFASSRR